MLTLYDCTTAPSPRRTRIFLAEKGVTYDNIQIDLAKQEQLGEAFGKINPGRTVPALVTDDGLLLTENVAIASYIDELYPEPPLMGRTPAERAIVLQWNAYVEMGGLMAVAEILRNTAKGFKGRGITGSHNFDQIPDLAERGRARLPLFFKSLNAQLTKTPFVAGETFSFSDIGAGVVVDFARWVKAYPDDSLEALAAWHKRVKERPSWQA